MEDNYYKKGKDNAMQIQAQGRHPAVTRSRPKTSTAKMQNSTRNGNDIG